MVLRKLCQVLIEVEDDGDRDDENDGEEVGANEFLDDVPIHAHDVAKRIEDTQYTEAHV
jgi:hypothetical protein